MKTVVISADDDKVAKLLTRLAKKTGRTSYVLNKQKKEDIGLIHAIDKGMKSEKLPIQTAYGILGS